MMNSINAQQELPGRRLKVLFITPWYPSQEQPVAGVFVREHAKAVQLYDDVVVFHSQRRSHLRKLWEIIPELDESLSAGLPTWHIMHRQLKLPNSSFFLELGGALSGLRRLRQQGFRPDIIHGHTYTSGAIAVLLGKLFHVPAIVTEHSTEFPRKLLKGAGLWKARVAFGQAALVLPVSMALQRGIEAYGLRARFQIVPNVVDTQLFHPVPRIPGPIKRLLTVALLDPSHKKGIPVLLQALSQLPRSDWQLDIVGDGPARAEYEQLVKSLNLTCSVKFHGSKSKAEVAQFMQQADLFVLPSRFETFSVVTAEALATGLPVLVTQCGGPEEFVSAEVGMTVPVEDMKALQIALNAMMDTLDTYVPVRIAEYAAMRFSAQTVGAKLHSIYLQTGKACRE
ncbi:MAG TPA: glycosyltransferase [Anaerolineae bacterium]|nr:glycosyltransferase [Anaerolineae bacterium]